MAKKTALFVLLLLAASMLFAGEAMPWDDALTTVQKALSGKTAMTIGIILIIGGGIALAFTEGQALKKLFWILIGIGVALNAATLAQRIFGSAAGYLL